MYLALPHNTWVPVKSNVVPIFFSALPKQALESHWVQIPSSPLTSYVILGKPLNLPVPTFFTCKWVYVRTIS